MSSSPEPDSAQEAAPDSRAYVTPRSTPAQFPRKYKNDRTVWLQSSAGAKWYKIAEGSKDSFGRWTYRLKDVDNNDQLYNNGEWVAESQLKNA